MEKQILYYLLVQMKMPQGFPKPLFATQTEWGQIELLTEKLGKSVKHLLFHNNIYKLTEASIFNLILQVLDRLQTLHEAGFAHGKVEKQNIFCGVSDPSKIYLANFQNSRNLKQDQDKVISDQTKIGMVKSFYLPINSRQGTMKHPQEKATKKSDLEGVLMLMIQLLLRRNFVTEERFLT